jgi:hypothetical protein
MNINNNLNDEEKKSIISDEYSLIKSKIEEETELNIFRIPRILYDMFHLLKNSDTIVKCYYMVVDSLTKMFRTIYKIDKHFYMDNSLESNMLFIPPMHPYLQLLCEGELWHPRSKIFNGSNFKGINQFTGIYAKFDEEHDIFPDYLTSTYTKDVMIKKFNFFIRKSRKELINPESGEHIESVIFGGSIDIYHPKYTKYKQKYMSLKKEKTRKKQI